MDDITVISLDTQKHIKRKVTVILLALMAVHSFVVVQVNPLAPFVAFPSIVMFFGENFFPPDFSGSSSCS